MVATILDRTPERADIPLGNRTKTIVRGMPEIPRSIQLTNSRELIEEEVMKKVPAHRNPIAKALAQAMLRPRVVRDKKKYSRKGKSRRVAPGSFCTPCSHVYIVYTLYIWL